MTQPCSKTLAMPRLALALVTGICSATGAYAQDPSHPLVLAAYVDAAGGADLTAGKYAAALAQINPGAHAASYRGAATHTNLCVAYIAMRDIAAAHAECNAAVVAAQSAQRRLSGWAFNNRGEPNQDLAVVYSNRAVLCDVEDDHAGAARDLAQAALFAPDAGFVRRNQDAIEKVNPTTTQVSAR